MPEYRLDISAVRKRAEDAGDLTDDAIARRSGVGRTTICRLLAGRTVPSLRTVVLLGKAYAVPVEDLLMEVEAA
ncbi:helix-turn-helix transcriptional regulator [Streptomyces sp. NPDC127037]|uniref:helix-turn-helix transcriptional regulator n=1 Tax=Streptomyces sp. NPDC127037 TaxID=3347113 RepID=UPI00364FB2EF